MHQEKHLRHAENYTRVLSVCMDSCYPTHIMLQRGQESFFKTKKDKKAQYRCELPFTQCL